MFSNILGQISTPRGVDTSRVSTKPTPTVLVDQNGDEMKENEDDLVTHSIFNQEPSVDQEPSENYLNFLFVGHQNRTKGYLIDVLNKLLEIDGKQRLNTHIRFSNCSILRLTLTPESYNINISFTLFESFKLF